MLCPETITSFISSYRGHGELMKHQDSSPVLLQSTCVITYYSPAWSSHLLRPCSYLFLARGIQHHFHKAGATSRTPNHINFLSFALSVSLHICNPQRFQHQYQTAQALFFQLSAETNASSFLLTIPASPASLQGNSTKQNPILNLAQLDFFLIIILTPFSISLLD